MRTIIMTYTRAVGINGNTGENTPDYVELAEQFGLGGDDIDPRFGIIAVAGEEGTYCIMVEASKAAQLERQYPDVFKCWSNPRISTSYMPGS